MKTKFLMVIIPFIIVFLLVAVVYPTMNYKTLDNNELSYWNDGNPNGMVCDENLWQPPSNCRPVEPYKPSLKQLQMVFNYCNDTSEVKNAIGLHFFNETHYIDNNSCEWQVLKNYPNSDKLCIPGQYVSHNDEEIRNDTHIFNKNKCLWGEEFSWEKEWGDKFQEPNNEKVKENEN